MLENCLVDNPKIGNHYESLKADPYRSLREDINNTSSKLSRIKPHLQRASRFSGWTLAGSILIGGLFAGLNWASLENRYYEKNSPSISQILMSSEIGLARDSTLPPKEKEKNNIALESIKDSFMGLEQRVREIDLEYSNIVGNRKYILGPKNILELTSNISLFDKRIAYSVLRSILIQDQEEIKNVYGETRHTLALTPKQFSERLLDNGEGGLLHEFSETQDIGFMQKYLRHLLAIEPDLPSVLAIYYSSLEDISKAKEKSGTNSYFPTIENGRLIHGYRSNLPKITRELTDRALALHTLTDNEGEVHFDYFKKEIIPRINSVFHPSDNRLMD